MNERVALACVWKLINAYKRSAQKCTQTLFILIQQIFISSSRYFPESAFRLSKRIVRDQVAGNYKWKYQIRDTNQRANDRVDIRIRRALTVIQCCAFPKCGRRNEDERGGKKRNEAKMSRMRDSKQGTNATPQLYNWFWNLILWCFLRFRDDWMYPFSHFLARAHV